MIFNTSIDAIEYVLPKKRQTVEEVSLISGISSDELEENLGYFERYITEKNESFLDLSEQAALKLMDKTSISSHEIDYIIFAYSGIYSSDQIRSPASKIQSVIKAKNAFCFEITNGCNSLNAAIHLADQILSGKNKKSTILVIASDTLSKYVDYTRPNVMHSYMYSDGAAALLISNYGNAINLVSSSLKTDGKYADISRIVYKKNNNTQNDIFPTMETALTKDLKNELLDDLVSNYIAVISECICKVNMTINEIQHIFLSRNSKGIYNTVLKYFNIESDRTFQNGNLFGHVGPIDSIIALSHSIKMSSVRFGDYILLSGTGVGFHWGSHLLQFNKI